MPNELRVDLSRARTSRVEFRALRLRGAGCHLIHDALLIGLRWLQAGERTISDLDGGIEKQVLTFVRPQPDPSSSQDAQAHCQSNGEALCQSDYPIYPASKDQFMFHRGHVLCCREQGSSRGFCSSTPPTNQAQLGLTVPSDALQDRPPQRGSVWPAAGVET